MLLLAYFCRAITMLTPCRYLLRYAIFFRYYYAGDDITLIFFICHERDIVYAAFTLI